MTEIIKTRNHHDIYDFVNPLKNPKLRESSKGKSVIITGAGEGIGRGIAEQFAHAGATTFFLSVRSNTKGLAGTAESVKSINPNAQIFTQTLDHTKPAEVEALFSTVKKELSTSADILVNNAGVSGPLVDIANSDVDKWWDAVEILLKGPYLMSKAYIQSALEAKKPGIIIHTSSIGSYWSVKTLGAYQVGKIGLNRLSEFIRIEHEKDGIISIAFHPGGVNTSWWDCLVPENPFYNIKDQLTIDTPALAGGSTVYLTTPEASYLSGRFVSVNWDLEELEQKKNEIVSKGLLITTARGDYAPAPY